MNRSAKESHKRISDSRNFGLYLHLITFALNGTPKESPRANTEWPNLSHYNFRTRNKQTISAQNKLAYCNSSIIRINANSVDLDQMPLSVVSDLGLHSLPLSLLWDAWH